MVAAVAGPLCLLLATAFLIPGDAPVRTAVLTGAGGIAAAGFLALVGRGGWGFMGMGLAGGIVILLPGYLGILGWLAVGWLRPGTDILASARNLVQVAVVLGMLTWAVPLGRVVNAWDVRRAKAYAERLAVAVEAEKARTGQYPQHEAIHGIARGVGTPPSLMADWIGYHPVDGGFEIDFQDRTEMFAGYVFRGPGGGWSHWVN